MITRFELSDLTEFKRWILGLGRHAVVLSPKKLANEIASELTEALSAYNEQKWRSTLFQQSEHAKQEQS